MTSLRALRLHRAGARTLLAAAVLAAPLSGRAHDTWLHVAAQQPGSGLLALELGTGARYPRSEGVIPGSRVVDSGCADDGGGSHGLAPRRELPLALELRTRVGDARAFACWMALLPVDIQLTPDLVRLYFDDVHAPRAVRDAWAAQQRAGIGWSEAYRKTVRIEAGVPGAGPSAQADKLRRPRGYPLELLPAGSDPVRANTPASFQALARGLPVPGLAIEFVSVRSPFGIWRETDAQGRVQVVLPFPGEWLLRSTAFDLPRAPDKVWHTRFATLTVVAR